MPLGLNAIDALPFLLTAPAGIRREHERVVDRETDLT
jgi:hypothetical protein